MSNPSKSKFHTKIHNEDDMVFSIDVIFMLVYVSKSDIELDEKDLFAKQPSP